METIKPICLCCDKKITGPTAEHENYGTVHPKCFIKIEAMFAESQSRFKAPGPVPAKELDETRKLKPKGRGGRRPGAGRRYLEPHQEPDRKITKSITLSAATWASLHDHSTDTLSKAIEALLQLHGEPNGSHADGWTESRRSDYATEEKFHEAMKKAKDYLKRRDYEENTADDPRIKG